MRIKEQGSNMRKCAIVLLVTLAVCFLLGCQMGRSGIGTANSKPGALGDLQTNIEVLPRGLVMRTYSFCWGTNLVQIHVTSSEGLPATNFVSEVIKVDKRTVLRTVKLDGGYSSLCNVEKGKSILEEDKDGDGHFEAVLFVTGEGDEMRGFSRTKSGELEILPKEVLEKYKKELFPWVYSNQADNARKERKAVTK